MRNLMQNCELNKIIFIAERTDLVKCNINWKLEDMISEKCSTTKTSSPIKQQIDAKNYSLRLKFWTYQVMHRCRSYNQSISPNGITIQTEGNNAQNQGYVTGASNLFHQC